MNWNYQDDLMLRADAAEFGAKYTPTKEKGGAQRAVDERQGETELAGAAASIAAGTRDEIPGSARPGCEVSEVMGPPPEANQRPVEYWIGETYRWRETATEAELEIAALQRRLRWWVLAVFALAVACFGLAARVWVGK